MAISVGWAPGGNFINVLRAAFARTDPERAKRQKSCQSSLRFGDLHEQKLHEER